MVWNPFCSDFHFYNISVKILKTESTGIFVSWGNVSQAMRWPSFIRMSIITMDVSFVIGDGLLLFLLSVMLMQPAQKYCNPLYHVHWLPAIQCGPQISSCKIKFEFWCMRALITTWYLTRHIYMVITQKQERESNALMLLLGRLHLTWTN
jgi:hypothetical protein